MRRCYNRFQLGFQCKIFSIPQFNKLYFQETHWDVAVGLFSHGAASGKVPYLTPPCWIMFFPPCVNIPTPLLCFIIRTELLQPTSSGCAGTGFQNWKNRLCTLRNGGKSEFGNRGNEFYLLKHFSSYTRGYSMCLWNRILWGAAASDRSATLSIRWTGP